MTRKLPLFAGSLAVMLTMLGLSNPFSSHVTAQQPAQGLAPKFVVDPFWPKPLPNRWILGQVAGVAVDAQDHVWIVQRPKSLSEDEKGATLSPPRNECCVPAPPVMEFDPEGNLVQAWGGPGAGYDWPENEHGIFVDAQSNVWLAGNAEKDAQILKFTRDGRFQMQIGKPGMSKGDADTAEPEPARRRPARSGDQRALRGRRLRQSPRHRLRRGHRRLQASLGRQRTSPGEAGVKQFQNPVHCVRIARDGLVYVCDRRNNRIQVFKKDGTFVKEFALAPDTRGAGSVWDLDFSTDGDRPTSTPRTGRTTTSGFSCATTGRVLSHFARSGRYAGQLHWVHNMAVDSKGNIYTAEVDNAKRVQKFAFQGLFPVGN